MHITLRHKSARGRSTTMVGVLLAIILPASLIMGSLAAADTADSKSSVPQPTRLEQTATGQPADPSANAPTLPTMSASPQSPLPSPLNTASPITTTQPAPDKPGDTGIQSKTADSQPQTRAATHTITFDSAGGNNISQQTVTDGEQASRPDQDPSRVGYTFDGWFTGNVAYDFTQPVTKDLTLTAKWTVWSLSPSSGQTAGGNQITLTTPTTPGMRFSRMATGYTHSLALGSDGNIYSWGDNKYGQLGRTPSSTTPADRPGIVTRPEGVKRFTQISAGADFSLAIGSDGNIYSWGFPGTNEDYNMLGRDTKIIPADHPGIVTRPEGVKRFTQISAGYIFSLAIGDDGNIYSWGNEKWGILGRYPAQGPAANRPGKVILPRRASKPTQISAGDEYSLAIDSNGTLYSWGWMNTGRDGDLGDLPNIVSSKNGVSKFTQISAGDYDLALALGSDGNIYSWGTNEYDQLGRTPSSTTPAGKPGIVTPPEGVKGFTQISAEDKFALVIGSDGILYSWGNNDNGQLGRDTGSASKDGTPRAVLPPKDAQNYTLANAGGYTLSNDQGYSLALASDGNLYSWGNNDNGQLGRDTTKSSATKPGMVVFPGKPTLTSVSFGGTAGRDLTANADGTWSVTAPPHSKGWVNVAIAWSMNEPQPDAYLSYTYIGPKYNVGFTSTAGSCTTPSGMPKTQSVTEDNQAKRPYPDPQAAGCLFDGWFLKDAKGGSKVAYDFSQPVTADITLVAHWSPANTGGWSISPDKGNVLGGQQATITPPKLSRGIRFSQVSANVNVFGFSVGVASDGNAYAWGYNDHGQLGQDPEKTAMQKTPTRVPLPAGVASGFTYTQVAAGANHVLAVGSDGLVYSWGNNDHGQLGDNANTNTERFKPQPVKGADGQPFKAVQVSAGYADSAAISPDGRVYTWGSEYNSDGEYSPSKWAPTLAKDPNGSGQGLHAVQVSIGWGLVMALDADGNVYTWGFNNFGQLGNGTSTAGNSRIYAADPARVADPKDTSKNFKATQISARGNHAMAIAQDGAAWIWGRNDSAQLGNGTKTNQPTPKQIQDPTSPSQAFQAVQISAGVVYSLAIDRSGAVWAWGSNDQGQLGINNSNTYQQTPIRVSPPAGQGSAGTGLATAQISAGFYHSLAIGRDGNAYSWGNNWCGQLGNTSIPVGLYSAAAKSLVPVPVALDPQLLIAGVKFDQAAVGSLQQNPDGSVSFVTPAHNPGQADVVVDWTLGGTKQEPAHLAYTYEGVLPLTGGNGSMILLLAAGLLAAAGAAAAGRHRRETRIQHA